MNMVSLNVAMFILMPVATALLNLSDEQKEQIIEHRKKEHVNLILNSLRP